MTHAITLALLLLWIGCAWWALVGAMRNWQQIRVKMAVFYLGYVAVVPALSLLPWLLAAPNVYRWLYWTTDLLHDFILCVVGIQLISHLIPKRFAFLWSYGFLLLLLFAYYKTLRPLPARIDDALLNLTVAGDYTVLVILVCMVFFPGIKWTKEYALITAGIVLISIGDAFPTVQWLRGLQEPWLSWILQVGPLPGLLVMGFGVRGAGPEA
jgi:hypothetical protein